MLPKPRLSLSVDWHKQTQTAQKHAEQPASSNWPVLPPPPSFPDVISLLHVVRPVADALLLARCRILTLPAATATFLLLPTVTSMARPRL